MWCVMQIAEDLLPCGEQLHTLLPPLRGCNARHSRAFPGLAAGAAVSRPLRGLFVRSGITVEIYDPPTLELAVSHVNTLGNIFVVEIYDAPTLELAGPVSTHAPGALPAAGAAHPARRRCRIT